MKQTTPRQDMLEIIFAHRNKAYGAYQLRRDYPRHLLYATACAGAAILLLLLLTRLGAGPQAGAGAFVSNERVIEVGKKEKPKGKKPVFSPPKQVKTTPAAPRRATIAFQPPVVTRDEMAPETTQADVETLAASTAEIGAVDASGDPNAAPSVVEDDFLETGTPAGNAPADDQAFSIIDVQKLPAFPGGDEAMMDFIRQHLTYPAYARELGIQGTVVLSFTVGKNGAIYDIQTIKDIGAGCAQEAARVVALMPAWRPGEANGQAVKVRFTLPIRFRLQ